MIRSEDQKTGILWLSILVLIYLVNDFLFIPVNRYLVWLAIDYLARLLSVAVIVILIRNKAATTGDFGLVKINAKPLIVWSIVLTATGIFIDQVGWRFFESILPKTGIIHFPKAKGTALKAFDLTFGVGLVAITEELIFRGYFYTVVKKYVKNTAAIVVVSVIVFGMIHWAMGIHAIVTTAIWGILPIVAMIRTGSIIPAIIAHYLTDLVAFAPLMPERWFDFMK